MSKFNQSIAFVGAGNMASSIIHGLVNQGYPAELISAAAPDAEHLSALNEAVGIRTSANNRDITTSADVIVLAVKPQVLKLVCEDIRQDIKDDALIISIAAGVTGSNIEKWLDKEQAIVRCMPNTPAQLKLGASGLYANPKVTEAQKDIAETILQAVGIACWVKSEDLIDAVTAVSGSGPAYFFLFMEAMIDAAVKQGMDRDTASQLAIQTGLGAAKLAQESEDDLVELRRKVTSPNGTTEKAIASFEADKLRDTVTNAMEACAQRARELAELN